MTTQATSPYLNQPTRDYLTARAARLATKLREKTMRKQQYKITLYRRGRTMTYRFDTLESARKAAADFFARTGIVVGIEQA